MPINTFLKIKKSHVSIARLNERIHNPVREAAPANMAASHEAWGRVYRFLYANKNRSEHLVKTSLSSEAPTDIKDGHPPHHHHHRL